MSEIFIPEGWGKHNLEELTSFIGRGQGPSYIEEDFGVTAINQKCVRNGAVTTEDGRPHNPRVKVKQNAILQEGDVCINSTGTGTIGRVGLWKQPQYGTYFVDSHVTITRSIPEIVDSKVLSEILNIEKIQNDLETYCFSGSTNQVELNRAALLKLNILIANDLKEQQKIAKILTTVDNLIEKTETLIEKYQVIKQGMMHDLFTRGIDANGQLRPSHTDAPHLYKQTELGRIPKEWEARKLMDVADKVQDGTHFSPQSSDGECLYLTSKNIRFGYLDLENIERISEEEHDSIYVRCDVKYGDLLLTKDGANTGNAALNTIKEPFSMLSSVAFIRLDGVSAYADFLLHYLLSLDGQKRMKDQMSGNAITRLTLTKINDFLVLQPPRSEQRLIADRLNSIKITIESEEICAKKLKAIKKGLMQDLLTGTVRVQV